MTRQSVPVDVLCLKPHHLWDKQWLLLTSGDFKAGRFNAMTVGWGSLGTMWGQPFVQVVVRWSRYTYEFMEQYDTFTLCAFSEQHRDALNLLGTRVAAPGFAEAELILECLKIYWDDMKASHFLDPQIEDKYPKKDYHRIYYGKIVAVHAEARYTP